MLELINRLVTPAIAVAVIGFIGTLIRDEWVRRTQVRAINTAFLAEIQRLIEVVERHKEKFVGQASTAGEGIPPVDSVYIPDLWKAVEEHRPVGTSSGR